MHTSPILDFIEKRITEKTHNSARKAEQKLLPHNFTAYYSPSTCVFLFSLSLLWIIIAFITKLLFVETKLWFMIMILVGFLLTLLLSLDYLFYRCHVNSEGFTSVHFFIFKKKVLWKDVKRVEIRRRSSFNRAQENTLILRGENNKRLLDFSYDLVGFHLIIKMAKDHRAKKEAYKI